MAVIVLLCGGAAVGGVVLYRRSRPNEQRPVVSFPTAPVSAPPVATATPNAALPPQPRSQPAATPQVPSTAPIVEEAPPPIPQRLSVSSSWYEGADGYRRAKLEQQSAHVPMLVYFRVDWCPYCRRMDNEVLPASAVRRFLGDVVKVRVNPEASDADKALTRSFGVTGYPSVFVIPSSDARPEMVPAFTRSGSEDITVTAEKFVEACINVGLEQSQGLLAEAANKVKSGDYAGARVDLNRAIELDPKSATAHLWRGMAAARAGEQGKAIGDFKRAIDLDPKMPYSYAELATVYGRASQYDDAVSTLNRLIAVAPGWEHGTAFVMRGKAHAQKGDKAQAESDFAEACRRGNTRACNTK